MWKGSCETALMSDVNTMLHVSRNELLTCKQIDSDSFQSKRAANDTQFILYTDNIVPLLMPTPNSVLSKFSDCKLLMQTSKFIGSYNRWGWTPKF